MKNYSTVYLREENRNIRVLNSQEKPEISAEISQKWQDLINLMCEILEVPASLIMQITPSDMQVFLSSQTKDNPYKVMGKDSLGHGLYCETVIGRDAMLEVPDAVNSEKWKDNPDVKLNMISYLGFPLKWPDGAFFGTICSLDVKPRKYLKPFKDLMETFKGIVEMDLQREYSIAQLKKENKLLDYSIREIHHRIKNNFSMILNFIQWRSSLGQDDLQGLLKDVESRIQAVSLLHEKLYKSISFTPDSYSYISELSQMVVSNMTNRKVNLDIKVEDIDVGKHLLDFGVVIVELITNSIKHAFDAVEFPQIQLSLKKTEEHLVLEYQDNGKGVAEEFENGFGMLLFQAFAQKMHGSVEIQGERRNKFIFKLN